MTMTMRWFVLLLSACAGLYQVNSDGAEYQIRPRELARAFPACGAARVTRPSPGEYEVTACEKIATYRCDRREDPCVWVYLESVRAAPPPPPAAPPPPTAEQLAEAERLFVEAREWAKLDRFDLACRLFTRSDTIKRTFGTAANLGDCAERDRKLGLAWQLYDEAARLTSEPDRVAFARARAAGLVPRLSTVVVKIAEPTRAGLTVRIAGRSLPPARELHTLVDPGAIEVTVSAPGAAATRWTFRGSPGSRDTIDVPAALLKADTSPVTSQLPRPLDRD